MVDLYKPTSNQTIDHQGVVVSITGRKAIVRIEPQPSCGSCGSKSFCNLSGDAGKNVEISLDVNEKIAPGQVLTISLERSLGYRALLLGYLLPLVIIVGSLFLLVHVLGNEGIASLFTVVILVQYYVILYFFRHKIRDRFVFRIKK
ncbi:MAG TPA: SoxR reducing system RseC family protein [Bacteroidales bacterium]|nr:SoxR reducing system RseC family protein [Bacteroidales bacterium]